MNKIHCFFYYTVYRGIVHTDVSRDGSAEGRAADATSAVAMCRAFYQVFPHLSRTIFVCTTEHGGDFSRRDTLYDTVHDYLVQTHILWTPPVPPGAATADLCFHKAMPDIMGLWNLPLSDRQERDPQVTLTGLVICRARPDAKSPLLL